MCLNADTVQLPLDRGRAAGRRAGLGPGISSPTFTLSPGSSPSAGLGEGVGERRLAGGEHRLQRQADLQPELGECRAAAAQRGLRGRRERPAEHDRPPHLGPRHAGRPRDRVGHHPVKRPLPQFPGEQPDKEELLLRGCGREELTHQPLALRGRPLS